MKQAFTLALVLLIAVTLLPESSAAPAENQQKAKRSPQEEGEEAEATTPVWCNPSNPFR